MSILLENEWEHLNKMILSLYLEDCSSSLRQVFLKQLRHLIVFNLAEFSVGTNENYFFDSVQINMDNNEPVDFLSEYFKYLNEYGNKNIDWIFRYPESTVMRMEDILHDELFDESNFKKVYLKNISMDHCCTTTLFKNSEYLGEFSLYLAKSYGYFSKRDLYILNIVKDHLANKLHHLKNQHKPHLPAKSLYHLYDFKLTERELEIVQLVLDGMDNENLSNELYISLNTVKKHLSNIYEKMCVGSRREMIALCAELLTGSPRI